MMRPCLACGTPTDDTRCPDCAPTHRKGQPGYQPGTSRQARGYDEAWVKLSKRARRLQPFCHDCGTVEDLTTDHLPTAWQRKADGLPIRLADVEVVCRPCNTRRGTSRPGEATATLGTRTRGGRLGGRYIPQGVSE